MVRRVITRQWEEREALQLMEIIRVEGAAGGEGRGNKTKWW